MLKSTIKVSRFEKDLFEAIKEIQYGEIFGVEVPVSEYTQEAEVSVNFQDLVDFIRNGNQDISVLTIHNGDPVMAEQDFKYRCFRCRKKTKFPT